MLEGWSATGLSWAVLQVWGLGGAAVLLALFFLRPRPQKLEVSSDLLWQRAIPKRNNPLVRDIVLLFLQLLVLGGLVVALADLRASAEEASETEVQDRVWVVDTSLSMGAEDNQGRSRLDRIRERLIQTLDDLEDPTTDKRDAKTIKAMERAGPRIALVGAGTHPVLLSAPSAGERGRLRLALQQLEPFATSVDLPAALNKAGTLKGLRGAPVIEVFTDSADGEEAVEAFEGEEQVYLRSPFSLRPNLAIRAFGLRGSEGIPAEEEALVRVANFSPWPSRATLLIENESQVLGRAELELEPGQEITRRYRFDPLADKALLARLDGISFEAPGEESPLPDALPVDDLAWAFVEPVLPVRVMLVTSGNRYLERALALLPGVDLERVNPKRWTRGVAARAAEADVVFLDRFVPSGSLPPRTFLIAPPQDAGPFRVEVRRNDPVVTDWNRDHPLFAGLVLRDLEVQTSAVFAQEPGDERLLASPAGPLALARRGENGEKLIAWGFEFGRSDLPLRIAFPQILVNSLLWMREGRAVGPTAGTGLQVGEELMLAPPTRENTSREWLLERLTNLASLQLSEPSETFRKIPQAEGLQPFSLAQPGLYRMTAASETRFFAASVLESDESRLFPLPPQDTTSLRTVEEGEPGEGSMPLLWMMLCCGALMVLFGEFWLWLK